MRDVAVVEDTIPLKVPKEVCLANNLIWDETQKICIIKLRKDLKSGKTFIIGGVGNGVGKR